MSVNLLPEHVATRQPLNPVDYDPMQRRRGRPRSGPDLTRPAWSERIRELREARGLSQERLGDAVGKRQSTIGEYESGKTEPDIATFEKLGVALGTSGWWLAFGKPCDSDPGGYLIAMSEEKNRLFSWALHRVAHMLTEEGFDGDLPYLVAFTRKIILSATKDGADDTKTKKIILSHIEVERSEFRNRLDEIRKNSL